MLGLRLFQTRENCRELSSERGALLRLLGLDSFIIFGIWFDRWGKIRHLRASQGADDPGKPGVGPPLSDPEGAVEGPLLNVGELAVVGAGSSELDDG